MSGRVSPQNNNAAAATPESLALSRLRVKSISHPLQQCQITVFVPPNTVGAIIGRGGGKILSVQKEAMRRSLGHTGTVKISVLGGNNSPSHTSEEEGEFFPSASNTQGTTGATWNYHEFHSSVQENFQTDNEEDDEVPVIIRGDPIGCFAAVRQILPLVYHRHDPDVVFEVPIHRSKHNLLVGKGGLILAALSAEYEVRIMIPPNDLMENVGGTVNYWHQNPYSNDTESTMLFSQTATSPMNGNDSPLAINSHSTLPPNVIQLEGHIDKCEKCLVKMLSIVAGEKWIPPGVIVHPNKENEHENEQKNAGEEADNDVKAENVKAFAIVTANSDSPNVGQNKLRTIQRKTSTLIRRKKGRFMLKGVEYGATSNDDEMGVAEEPSVENDEDEEKDDAEEEEDDDQGTSGPKVSISFLISGKIENVKLAASQFEKILGLEPNTAVITLKDSPKSSSSPTSKGDTGDSDAFEKKRQKQRNFNRREKKRVGKNNTDKAGE